MKYYAYFYHMNTSLEIFKEIIHWLETYSKEQSENEISLDSFVLWLNSRLFLENHTMKPADDPDALDMELTFLLVMQSRFYKVYVKKVLGES